MTIQDWRQKVPLLLDAFVAATERMQEAGEKGFVGPQYECRAEAEWAREFAAYLEFSDLQEEAQR